VLNREFYKNDRTYPGVLSFSSYANNFGLFPLAPAARFFDYPGIQPSVILDRDQFVEPSTTSRIPDWRTLLYWQSSGKEVSTKLPNLAGTFVHWEQVNVGGKLTVRRTFFEVKN
jgi:hypothetical protein